VPRPKKGQLLVEKSTMDSEAAALGTGLNPASRQQAALRSHGTALPFSAAAG
jgi:hypothetical protein